MSNSYSIGFMREDGDFQILVTLSNSDETMSSEEFHHLFQSTVDMLNDLHKDADLVIQALEREDTPNYVTLDDDVRYEVQTEMLGTWENCWTDAGNNDCPLTFTTRDEAQEAIDDHIIDCINAVESGDMYDSPDHTDFRVVEVKP